MTRLRRATTTAARCSTPSGNSTGRLTDLNEAIKLDPKLGQAFSHRGIAYLGNGDVRRALADLNEGIRLAPKDPYTYSKRGDFYHAQGDNQARAGWITRPHLRIDSKLNEALEGREIALGSSKSRQWRRRCHAIRCYAVCDQVGCCRSGCVSAASGAGAAVIVASVRKANRAGDGKQRLPLRAQTG